MAKQTEDLLSKMLNKDLKRRYNLRMKNRRKKNYFHEVVIPYQFEARFKGVSIGYDKRPESAGYFVFTHRDRSEKSYKTIGRIPPGVIKYIASTG